MLHYCVPNMPGAVARTATYAFVNAAMPYIEKIANLGIENAIETDPAISRRPSTLTMASLSICRCFQKEGMMDWTSIYQSRIATAEEAVQVIKSGTASF